MTKGQFLWKIHTNARINSANLKGFLIAIFSPTPYNFYWIERSVSSMGKTKKWVLHTAFLLLVIGATAYGLLRGTALSQLLSVLRMAKLLPCLLGVGCVLGFILLESVILWLMLNALGHRRRMSHCSLYSFVGFFFSSITPSAGGGQPAQVYFMHTDGVGAGVSVPVLILVTITYKLVLVICGLGVMIFRPKGIMEAIAPLWWCVLGLILNALVVSGYGALLVFPNGTERMLQKLLSILPVSRTGKEKLRKKLAAAMPDFRDAAKLLGSRKKLCAAVFAITMVQRTLLFFVCFLAIRSLGLVVPPVTVIVLQAMIALGTDLLPLPGGMGANEAMFMGLFSGVVGAEYGLPVLVISRGISYYAQLLLSAVFTIVATMTIGKG